MLQGVYFKQHLRGHYGHTSNNKGLVKISPSLNQTCYDLKGENSCLLLYLNSRAPIRRGPTSEDVDPNI